MTIIKAINDLADKMLIKGDFSKIRSCTALTTVMEYFNINKESAILVSTFVAKKIDEEYSFFSIEDLERDWSINLTEILSLIPNLDDLLTKNILLLRSRLPYTPGTANRATQFLVDEELINVMCYNKSFSEYSPVFDANYKYNAITFVTEINNTPARVLKSKYLFSDFILPYREDKWISNMLLKVDDDQKEAKTVYLQYPLVFFLFAIKALFNEKSTPVTNVCEIADYSASETMDTLRAFKNGTSPLLKYGYLEIDKTDIADSIKVKFGKKVIDAFEGYEDLLLLDNSAKELNKIDNKDIKEKQLFYNKENQADIDRLKNILKEENYCNLRDRLSEKGLPKGLTVLLYGAPGTGKTETVMQLAKETGRDVFHLNIEQVKSCWVGESEKNVKGIFNAYYASKSKLKPILLFNEADAIISKRTAVDGSNTAITKMENAIQNILLEELEKFDGIFIATTNLVVNIDEAFDRRFLFKLKFENPTINVKEKIWKSKLDFINDEEAHLLASSYDLSGGQIDNIYRKSEVDYILYGTKPNVQDLLEFCKKEKLSNNNASPIGFNH